MLSVYFAHRKGQLRDDTSTVAEGTVFPLLRLAEGDELTWAYAVPKPKTAGGTSETRKHRLVCSVLKAFGFKLDENNPAPDGDTISKYDFFHLPKGELIDPIEKDVFKNLGEPAGAASLQVVDPKNDDDALETNAGVAEGLEFPLHPDATFHVDQFQFFGDAAKFKLGDAGSATNPRFEAVQATLVKDVRAHFLASELPELKFRQAFDDGEAKLECGPHLSGDEFQAVAPNNLESNANDTRHDRRMINAQATLVCLNPETESFLAVEVFPAIAFRPNDSLPITVALGHTGVSLRLPPTVDGAEGKTEVRLNHLRPCLHVTVQGPLIHAPEGAGELLKLLEPVERKLDQTVERINEFLTYSFEVCVREENPELTRPQLDKLDTLVLRLTRDWSRLESSFGAWLKGIKDLEFNDLFDVRIPDVALTGLTEYELPIADWTAPKATIELPDGLDLPDDVGQWGVEWKRRGRPSIHIANDLFEIGAGKVIVTLPHGIVPDKSHDRFVVRWSIPWTKISVVEIEGRKFIQLDLEKELPTPRLPRIGGGALDFDARFIRVKFRKAGRDIASFSLHKVVSLKQVLVEVAAADLAELEELKPTEIQLDVVLDLTFPLTKCFLSDVLGDVPEVDFRLSIPHPGRFSGSLLGTLPETQLSKLESLTELTIPFELVVRLPSPKVSDVSQWDEITVVLGFRFSLENFRLASNTIYFFLPQLRSSNEKENLAPRQVVDFDIFTLTFPNRREPLGYPDENNHDGYLNLTTREFVIGFRPDSRASDPPPRIRAFFPGGMDKTAARMGRAAVEAMDPDSDDYKKNYKKYHHEYVKRFELELEQIDPEFWPSAGLNPLSFRLSAQGVTFAAKLTKTEVEVDNSGFDESGNSDKTAGGLIRPFKFQPQEKQRELKSRLVIIDNQFKEAAVYATTEVPGVEGLMAEVSVVLRQRKRGALPDVIASTELERADESPITEFSIKLLELALDRIELELQWLSEEKEWDYSIIADGTVGFTGAAALVEDLEGLRNPSMKLIGLDLRRLNLREMRVPFDLVEPIRFEILDGMFAVELGDLELGWSFEKGKVRPTLLACELAKFEYKNPGALEVAITVGGLHIEFDEKLKAHIKTPSSLGIEVALGTTTRFAGRVGWVETKVERYFFASGKVLLEGLPEIKGLLKFGTGLKNSGREEINLVLYGEVELDEQIYSGVVVKSLGLGVGLNNRLAAIPARPSADAVIRRIDMLKPGQIEGWQFVREGGFYLSIVGSVTIGSQQGAPSVLNAYLAQLVLSIDTNFDIVVAGKIWISCSLDGQRAHPDNPAFVGAMVLSLRQQKLEVVLESRQDPYVEQNELIQKLFSKAKIRFAFRMTPQLVDFHLSELSYRDQMMGMQVEILGEYRFAIFKRAVLLRSDLSATGRMSRSLTAGPGGFDMDGQAYFRVGYGGLLSTAGAMAYAYLEAGIRFRVSAWIEIGFSISFKICGKRFTKSWNIVFRMRVPELELTFRGHVAIADFGGNFGVDCQVGINVSICGYRLRASGRLAQNPELYEEVRQIVAAFEDKLNKAVAELDDSGDSAGTEAPAGGGALEGLGGGAEFALDMEGPFAEGAELALEMEEATAAAQEVPAAALEAPFEAALQRTSPEDWLYYARNTNGSRVSLLLPTDETLWLTPQVACVKSIKVKGGVASFEIEAGGLPWQAEEKPEQIRLQGFRGGGVPDKLNGVWDFKEIDVPAAGMPYTIKLNVSQSDVAEGEFNPSAGVWGIVEKQEGLSPEDQETVPYLRDVERVAVRTGARWAKIADFVPATRILTTVDPHGFEGPCRILLLDLAENIVDPGASRRFDKDDFAVLTIAATPVIGESKQIKLEVAIPDIAAGWLIATAVEIAPTWNARNRLAQVRELADSATDEDVERYRDVTGGAAAWAETASLNGLLQDRLPARAGYAVVFDERYTSEDPQFSPPKLTAQLPAGVLPDRFRPLDEVEIVGADRLLAAARCFELASRAVAGQELHGALDLTTAEALVQSRAQAAHLLLHRLSTPGEPSAEEHAEAPLVNDLVKHPSKVAYGWLWATKNQPFEDNPIEKDNKNRVFVRRAGGQAAGVQISVPGKESEATRPLTPLLLPIRQEYVVDESSDFGEKGRVVVKLPIKFSADHLRRHMEDVGRLQIYRRVGSGPEELVADQIRPEVSFLDREHVFSRKERCFVDDVRVAGSEPPTAAERKDFRFAASYAAETGIVSRIDAIELLPAKENELQHPLADMKLRIIEKGTENSVELPIVDADADAKTITVPIADAIPTGDIEFELVTSGLIVPRPVVFSDHFSVVNREFVDAHLRAAKGGGRVAPVQYSLRMLTEDDPGGPNATAKKDPWPNPVPLFVPPQVDFPPSLGLAISVSDLICETNKPRRKPIVFQLIDLSGKFPTLATRDGRPFRAEDFELWLDADELTQSGFFAGESTVAPTASEADGQRVTLDDVPGDEPLESDVGKVQVPVFAAGQGPSAFQLGTDAAPYYLPEMKSLRLFVRPRHEQIRGLLQRAPLLLVRKRPALWDENVRFRLIETLEAIPSEDDDQVRRGIAQPVLEDFSADDLYAAGRAAIRAVWPSRSVLEGGVELQFRDFDESTFRSRTLVEVFEPDEFRETQRDFRDESFWALRPSQSLERYVSRVAVTAATAPGDDTLEKVYLWKRTAGSKIDAIERLTKAAEKFADAKNWQAFADAARAVQIALLSFEKSPLNLKDPAILGVIEVTRSTLRALIVGYRLPAAPADLTDEAFIKSLRSHRQSLLDLLTRVEQSRPESISDDVSESAAFLDRDTAKKLGGIIRRRLAVADDVLGLGQVRESHSAALPESEPLVRQTAWLNVLAEANIPGLSLPKTDDLRGRVDMTHHEAAVALCLKAIADLNDKIKDAFKDLAKLVPRAAGLTDLLSRFEDLIRTETSSPAGLLKRPHHELTTSTNEQGKTIAQSVPLRSLLPPDVRRTEQGVLPPPPDERLDPLSMRTGQMASLSAKGFVTIWTTRGESLREPLQRIQHFRLPEEKDIMTAAIELAEVAEGPRLLIDATYADGSRKAELWDAGAAKRIDSFADVASLRFAHTPRGLATLAIMDKKLQLAPVTHRAAILEFRKMEGEAPVTGYTGVAAYHDEQAVLMAARSAGGESLVFWRDLGRSNELPYAVLTGLPERPIQIQTLTLPAGPRAVVATANQIWLIDYTALSGETDFGSAAAAITPVEIPGGGGIKSIAVDRREMKLVVHTAAKLHLIKLLTMKPTPVGEQEIPASAAPVSLLHSRGESHAVVSDGAKAVCYRCGAEGLSKSQTLRGAGELGKGDEPGNVLALSSMLATARSARAAADVMNLMHLWERMGFAVDVAAQNATARLLTLNELRREAHRALRAMPAEVNGEKHYVYLVEGEEPDAEFRESDRVGFSHVKLAVVPEAFLKAALQDGTFDVRRAEGNVEKMEGNTITLTGLPMIDGDKLEYQLRILEGANAGNDLKDAKVNGSDVKFELGNNHGVEENDRLKVVFVQGQNLRRFEPLQKWLKQRSIDTAAAPEEALFELAHVAHLVRLVGVPTAKAQGVPETKSAPHRSEEKLPDWVATLAFQPASQRFIRVPASASFSHFSWKLPDRKGHRILVGARRVSRYEPLLRWWRNYHFRFDLPEEVSLREAVSKEDIFQDHRHAINAIDNDAATVKLAGALEPASGIQPLRIEIVTGQGVGQRREVLCVDEDVPGTFQLDGGDPWLSKPAVGDECRVIDAAPGWRLVEIDPIHDPARGEGPRPLMVYQYPHSRKPRFSFQIPLDGMRAIYNQISRVRTGYHGFETVQRYALLEKGDTAESATLDALLAAMFSDGLPDAPCGASATVVPTAKDPIVHLFRHERMASWPELPFFYKYRLDVRSVYKSRRLEYDRTTAADRLPVDDNASPPARRKPALLGLPQAEVDFLEPLVKDVLPDPQPESANQVLIKSGENAVANRLLQVRPTAGDAWSKPLAIQAVEDQGGHVLATVTPAFDTGEPQAGWQYRVLPHAYAVTLFVSANRNHLTREESDSEPRPIVVHPPSLARKIEARDLPDFQMDYAFFSRVPLTKDSSPLPSLRDLFASSGSIRMPWSAQFQPPPGFSKYLPLVSLASGLKGATDYAIIDFRDLTVDTEVKLTEVESLVKQFGNDWFNDTTAVELRPLQEGEPDKQLQFKFKTDGVLQPAPAGDWTEAWKTVDGDIKELRLVGGTGLLAILVRVTTAAGRKPAHGREFSVPLELVTPKGGDQPQWRLRFRLAVDPGQTGIIDPEDVFLQGFREGTPTRAEPLRLPPPPPA